MAEKGKLLKEFVVSFAKNIFSSYTFPTMIIKNKRVEILEQTKMLSSVSIPWRQAAKENIEKFGESGLALRGSRYKEEMTQKELADAIGVRPHHISEMENGKRPIGKEMAKRLAEVFKVNYRIFL